MGGGGWREDYRDSLTLLVSLVFRSFLESSKSTLSIASYSNYLEVLELANFSLYRETT